MTAQELQRYVLEVHAPLAAREYLAETNADRWYQGTCDSTCAIILEELGDQLAPFRIHEWGGFVIKPRGRSAHCWLEAPDGTIVDPTSEQFGLEPCAIILPDDPRQSQYLRSRWDG